MTPTWLRRIVRCRCGRRCADVRVTSEQPLPDQLAVVVEYVCEGCGTTYLYNSRTERRERRNANALLP